MTFPVPTTPVGLAALTINVVFAPLIGWMVKSGRRAAKKLTVQGVKLSELESKVKKLQTASDACQPRFARLETAIQNIERAAEASKEQHKQVMEKLEQLPRLATLLEMYSSAIAAIVPRPEVDSRYRNLEDRLRLLESDVRKGGADAGRV